MNIAVESVISSLDSKNLPKAQHLDWLNQIRGAAALYVVFHHSVMQIIVIGDHAHDPFYRILQLLTGYGHYAVDIFIVLSGYCLMLPLLGVHRFGNVWSFYLRRTVRIVLPYYAALAFSLVMIFFWIGDSDGSHWARVSLPYSYENVLEHFLLIHQWFFAAQNKINPAFWSVGVEYQIYFLFPALYLMASKIGFVYSFCVVTFTSYALWGISLYWDILNPSSNGTSIYYCSLFFMGMAAAHYANQTKKNGSIEFLKIIGHHSKKVAIAAVVGILIVATTGFFATRFGSEQFFPLQVQSFFVGLFAAVILYLNGSKPSRMKDEGVKFMLLDKLGVIGCMGFSIYLLHDPVLAFVWKYLVVPLHIQFYWAQTVVELIVGSIASILVAAIFYKLVELPCHQFAKSISKK